MSTLAATRTTGKQKTTRSVRVTERNTAGQPLAIAINDGKETCTYDVLLIESVDDGCLWRIKKTSGKNINSIYDTFISIDHPQCDCPAGVYHGHCKHQTALAALTVREGQRRPFRTCQPIKANPAPVELCDGERHCQECQGFRYKHFTLDAKQSVIRCHHCDGTGIEAPF